MDVRNKRDEKREDERSGGNEKRKLEGDLREGRRVFQRTRVGGG